MTKQRELLPCPFCGEQKIFLNDPHPDGYRYGSINCPACLVVMPGEVNSRDELIGCWNTRAAAPAQEPVAWRSRSNIEPDWNYEDCPLAADDLAREDEGFEEHPLYALPLTGEQGRDNG